ncbi:hypothetical protein C2G38_2039464 [Gigaspora rosea]|uniref:Uncharacterized protein n=1 Tax=Gigaspora rosea TaxID=44941 RepID=A0A397V0C9_9GLOM|nr:hypothetical protein C2G38_2039464 [Gigaspora rosea]
MYKIYPKNQQWNRRRFHKEFRCSYCSITEHNISRCFDVKELKKNCTTLITIFTEEQVAEVQEIVNKVFSYSEIHEEQVPEALEFLLEILEDIIKKKALKKRVLVSEVRKSHYAPETSVKDDNEDLTNEEKNLKKKETKLSLEAVLEELTNTYLKVLKNWIPEPTKPKELLINLKESLKTEPNGVNTIVLNLQITEINKIGNLKF